MKILTNKLVYNRYLNFDNLLNTFFNNFKIRRQNFIDSTNINNSIIEAIHFAIH